MGHNSLLGFFFLKKTGSGLCKGTANNIIFDAQDMKFVKKHTHIHTMTVYCMYWSQINGSLLAYYNGQLNLKYSISMNHL